MFIAFEGIDGSGKTTVSKLVAHKLQENGLSVFLTHEPTDSFKIPDELSSRRDPESALKLFFRFTEDRFSHQKTIASEMEGGKIVISDRYLLSSIAYQGPLIEEIFGSQADVVRWMISVSDIISVRPDINILLDVRTDVAIKRVWNRKKVTGFEDMVYLEKVRSYYLGILRKHFQIIIGEKSPDATAEEIVRFIMQSLQ